MSKTQWEYDLVERPFCERLRAMGWQWIEGDTDVPEFTGRRSFREVLLKARLAASLRALNLRDGKPWLDGDRIRRIIDKLEWAAGHRLMDVNESATQLLLKGTEIEGLPDWDSGRNQPVRFIDFENTANNDFAVVNQFKVELTRGRGHVIPDAVLFVNGIPVVLAEFKSPGIENPLQEATNQLLRYTNQRREIWPTLYTENEGVERLFHTNQLLIASDIFEARAGAIGAPPEACLEWVDTSPVPISTVAEELGLLARSPAEQDAAQQLAEVGPEQSERCGTPLFFRERDKRPPALRDVAGATMHSQQILVAGILRPAHLLDLIRNFTVFQQVDGKTRKVVARCQQFRAIHKAVDRLQTGRTKAKGADRDERGGIVWHTDAWTRTAVPGATHQRAGPAIVAMRACLAVLCLASSVVHAWCPGHGDTVAWRVESMGLFPRGAYPSGCSTADPPEAFAYADSTIYVYSAYARTLQRHYLRTNETSSVHVGYNLVAFTVYGSHIVSFDNQSIRVHRATDLKLEFMKQIASDPILLHYRGGAYFDRQYLVISSYDNPPKVGSVYDFKRNRMATRTGSVLFLKGIYGCRSCDTSSVGYGFMNEKNSRVLGESRELVLFENGPLLDANDDSTCYYVLSKETAQVGQLRNFSYRYHPTSPSRTSFHFMSPRRAVFCRNVLDTDNVYKTEFLMITFD